MRLLVYLMCFGGGYLMSTGLKPYVDKTHLLFITLGVMLFGLGILVSAVGYARSLHQERTKDLF